jgi:sec-independent protein translocase protein TatA
MGPDQFRIVMNILAFGIGNLGGPDLLIILLIVFVLFGAKKLPDLARSLGQSMNEFRKARRDLDEELHNVGTQSTQPPPCQRVASVPGAQQINSAPRAQ